MDMKRRIADLAGEMLKKAFPEAEGLPEDLYPLLEVPPDSAMGDYAFPCFKLSRVLRLGPPVIARKLAEALTDGAVARVECAGGYLNFFFNRENFARDLLSAVLAAPEKWGGSDEGRGKTVCVEYSSINIAKRFHLGHLSTTVIGKSLRRIYDFLGWKTVSINYLGDWGTQFGKMLCAYKKWGDKETVEKGGVEEMTKLYVRFNTEAEQQPAVTLARYSWAETVWTPSRAAILST